MNCKFFIERPRFAFVVSIVIMLVGFIAMKSLPLEEYPSITPPQVSVTATYMGASSDVIESTVAAPIESAVNGVEHMLYMTSDSKDGTYSLNIFFEVGYRQSADVASILEKNGYTNIKTKKDYNNTERVVYARNSL